MTKAVRACKSNSVSNKRKMGVSQLSDQQARIVEQKTITTSQDQIAWEDLLWNLRHLEIRILELIYLPEAKPLAFGILVKKLKGLNYSERTIRRKIQKLEILGLASVIRSTITIINPIMAVQKNIQNLTILWNHRDRNL